MESCKGNDEAESLCGGDSMAAAQQGSRGMHGEAQDTSTGVDLSRTSSASSTSSWNVCDEADSSKDGKGTADGSSVAIAPRTQGTGKGSKVGKRTVTFDFSASRVIEPCDSGRQDTAMSLSDLTSDTVDKRAKPTRNNSQTSPKRTSEGALLSATARIATTSIDQAAVENKAFSWSFPMFSFTTRADADRSASNLLPMRTTSDVSALNSSNTIQGSRRQSPLPNISPTTRVCDPSFHLHSRTTTAPTLPREHKSIEDSRVLLEAVATPFKELQDSGASDCKDEFVSEALSPEFSQRKTSGGMPGPMSQAIPSPTATGTKLLSQQPPSPLLFTKRIFWSTVMASAAGETAKKLPCMSSASIDPTLFEHAEQSLLGPIYMGTMNRDTSVQVTFSKVLPGKKAFVEIEKELVEVRDLPVHPNLISIYGHCHMPCGKQVALVSESARGLSHLDSVLGKGATQQLTQNKHETILQLVRAIEFLHSYDVTHRCLSSENVLIDQNGTIKVTNYGVPTLKNAAACAETSTGAFVGFSGPYASPELLRGELSRSNAEGWKKSDVYSVCVLVMELLLEEKAWAGEIPAYYTKAVMHRGARPFDTAHIRVGGTKSERLHQAISSGWNQDPKKRLTATQLRQALEKVFLPKNQESTDTDSKPMPGEGVTTADASLTESFVCQLPRARPAPVFLADDARHVTANLRKGEQGNVEDKSIEEYPTEHNQDQELVLPLLSTLRELPDDATYKNSAPCTIKGARVVKETQKMASDSLESKTPIEIVFTDLQPQNAKHRSGVIQGVGPVGVMFVDVPPSNQLQNHFNMELTRVLGLAPHPNIARHFGRGIREEEGRVGLITEQPPCSESVHQRLYYPGTSVLSEKAKLSIIVQVVNGLAFLHQNDVVHGRLSVTNVLCLTQLVGAHDVKLCNYGFSSLSIGDDHYLSPLNSPPEILSGDLQQNDLCGWKKCDIYAFAVFIMEVLTEDRPWFGELPVHVVHAVTNLKQRPYDVQVIRVLGRRCPDLEDLVSRAWHQDPAMRPSAAEMLSQLCEIFQIEMK